LRHPYYFTPPTCLSQENSSGDSDDNNTNDKKKKHLVLLLKSVTAQSKGNIPSMNLNREVSLKNSLPAPLSSRFITLIWPVFAICHLTVINLEIRSLAKIYCA
jgi:hypothetical protein